MSTDTTTPKPSSAATIPPQSEWPPYLALRGKTFNFKRKFPALVVRHSGGRYKKDAHQWKSLGTSDFEVAVKRLAEETTRFDRRMDALIAKVNESPKASKAARGEGTTKYLLPEHIPYILERYACGILQDDDEEREGMNPEERAEHIERLESWIFDYKQSCAIGDFLPVEELSAEILSLECLIAPPGSEVRQQFLWELMSRDIELAETQLARARGKLVKAPKELPIAPRDIPTMRDLYCSWALGQKIDRTKDTYLSFVEEFEALYGALPVASITHDEHGLGYRNYLGNCDWVRPTVQNRIGGLATLVRHGVSEGLVKLAGNPFDHIKLDMIPDTPASEQRRSYELAELQTIFGDARYPTWNGVKGQCAEVAHWGPLVGIFTGARIEEVCQARVDDVRRLNGVWVLRITNLGPDQRLKADGSFRYVPIHDELIECGFLQFAAEQKRGGHERLFPSLSNDNKNKTFSSAYSKWYGRYLDALGMSDPRLCYHSFRFSFKQQLAICNVQFLTVDALAGHWLEEKVSGRGYMRVQDRQYPLPLLVDAIKKLKYEGLDLSRFIVGNPMDGVDEVLG
ncbi:site-specific integrase [Leptothrix discophora]|uniref:Site-specific integrase n=1 Tax=Leptothrix discophora TaxID=89 RepID=A0ABT9G634_LEPDI|nr:site-specific integrase [Leptothrix discophora]MDP4301638.1 site-specific integrase [Leptothrix discophora]